MTNVTDKRKGGGQSPPLRGKECWASPKGISLSAESDKGVAVALQMKSKKFANKMQKMI